MRVQTSRPCFPDGQESVAVGETSPAVPEGVAVATAELPSRAREIHHRGEVAGFFAAARL